ncbi:hypothetical protein [Streptomyces sp. NPDC058739]|uniref:hypothetical protein n=1 Tax=Streptomyces sp. NPDC058739 TaxID=3346618 RepID=UPI0036B47EC8
MTEGEAVASTGVRVRLDGGGGGDVSALKKWLEQEQPLAELIGAHQVTVEERHRTEQPDGRRHMGFGTEIVLVIVGSTATVTVTALIEHVQRAVKAWLANRRQVESGDPPRPAISELDSDET